ncbi:MAG: hypothetical protein LBG22_10695 [Treponema sp.]|jgi:hypothetical protein|nr:hypothetical protein [Treponema sp.]
MNCLFCGNREKCPIVGIVLTEGYTTALKNVLHLTDNGLECGYYDQIFITPAEYKKRQGREYPDYGAVRVLPDQEGEEKWELMEYWRAKQLDQDIERLDKDFGDEHKPLLVVIGSSIPPDDWRLESDKEENHV